MEQPSTVERSDRHSMPWHFKAEDEDLSKDCILVATMLGNEMQAVSLHVVSLPDATGWS